MTFLSVRQALSSHCNHAVFVVLKSNYYPQQILNNVKADLFNAEGHYWTLGNS